MKRLSHLTTMTLLSFATVALAFGSHDARAQVEIGVGVQVTAPDVEAVVEPPAAYIATVEPEYYGGRPVYFYNNYWYYRDGYGRWEYYRDEPAYLRERREHWGWRAPYGREGWGHGGYMRGGYEHERYDRGGYVRGGMYEHGHEGREGFVRGGGGPMRGGPARYHYRR